MSSLQVIEEGRCALRKWLAVDGDIDQDIGIEEQFHEKTVVRRETSRFSWLLNSCVRRCPESRVGPVSPCAMYSGADEGVL